MKTMKSMIVAAGLALALVATRADAQQSGLVNVDIGNVTLLNDIANNLHVNVSQIPVTVQAPIGIAATVCDVNANVLAEQTRNGGARCDAQSTNTAFNEVVQRQLIAQ
jgi:hypothetical protein